MFTVRTVVGLALLWAFCLVVALAFSLAGCTGVQEGTPVDLRTLAQPDPAAPPLLPKPSRPPPQAGKLRVWVPRQETSNGDVQEGYWLTLSAKPPTAETVEPPHPLPRLPHQYQPKRQPPTPSQRQQPAQGTRQIPPGSQGLRPPAPSTGVPLSLGVPGTDMTVPGTSTTPLLEVP